MNLASLDLNLLLAFEAMMEERSVTAAARRLGIGQSGMSAALGRLRKLLGDELFVRVRGEMRPTAKAAELAPGIASAFRELRRTLEAVAFDPRTASRSFAVGSTDYTAAVLLPRLVAHVRRIAPGISLHVISYEKGSVAAMLDDGELDVALGVFLNPPERAVVKPLFQERFVGIARADHPAVAEGAMTVRDYAALAHALVTTRRDATGAVDEVLAANGLARHIALTLPYALALPAVLHASDLVAAVPARLAEGMVSDGSLRCFELPVAIPEWTVSMLWPSIARRDQATMWLRECIVSCSRSI